jgi:hypothetical protein
VIASARLYEWAPSLTAAWRRLLEWVSARAGVGLEFLDGRAVGLDELWAREDLGCVFMCGYPWARSARRPALLAAPVPALPRYAGPPVYLSDFIVSANRAHRTAARRVARDLTGLRRRFEVPRVELASS